MPGSRTGTVPAKKRLSDYFGENFYVTTLGNFHTPALLSTMLEIGADRIMFSTDWPLENIDHAAVWFDACLISGNDSHEVGECPLWASKAMAAFHTGRPLNGSAQSYLIITVLSPDRDRDPSL
jgi:hypothetical protein